MGQGLRDSRTATMAACLWGLASILFGLGLRLLNSFGDKPLCERRKVFNLFVCFYYFLLKIRRKKIIRWEINRVSAHYAIMHWHFGYVKIKIHLQDNSSILQKAISYFQKIL